MSVSDAWYFLRVNRSNRQANIGNTLLVNRGDDIWCLGYIQDIEGDHVFIDLDCAQYAPSWVHSRHVWQHHLICVDKKLNSTSALNIHVALKNEAHGPYIFRPAQLLDECSEDNLYLCCIMDDGGNRRIVHRWQIVATLPQKELSVFGRLDEISIVKHVVHSRQVNWIQAIDECQISKLLKKAFAYRTTDDGRFFVRIGKDTVTIIVLDNLEMVRNRTAQELPARLDKFLELYIQSGNPRSAFVYPLQITGPASMEAGDKLHCVLSWDILSEILRQLDFHSQLKAKRVCSSWSLVLTEPASHFVEIDFCNILHKKTSRSDTEGYVIACVLDRAVTNHTKTLVLTSLSQRVNPFRGMKLISSLLCLKGIQLNTIGINKCEVLSELYHTVEDISQRQPLQLRLLMTACRRLVVSQYRIKHSLFCCWNTALPITHDRPTREVRYRLNPLPSTTISHMVLDCFPLDQSEINRRIIVALERHCRPVDDEVREQFREMHAQWVRSVPYPDGWTTFRRMLQKHFIHEESVPVDYWGMLDLRDFETLPLNKFMMQLIAHKYF